MISTKTAMAGNERVVSKSSTIIVGAAGGIGRALTGILLERGLQVLALDRNGALLKNLPLNGGLLETMELDITDRSGVSCFTSALAGEGRRYDGLVITAGIHSTHPVQHLSDELVDRVLDVNLASHIKLVRDFLPLMNDGGSIIGVSSIAACVGVPMSSMYSASKRGLEGFYESLYTEMKHRRMRVSVIHPGNVNTGFNETGNTYRATGDSYIDTRYTRVVEKIDSRHGIPPGQVARVIAKVLSKHRPRFCYVVGKNARKANWALKLLGRDMAIRLMGKFFGF
ncbi:MAG: SDR family NAD(P)-dependent oxidoreductase [Candidatus Fermentibacteraceae bacterium]